MPNADAMAMRERSRKRARSRVIISIYTLRVSIGDYYQSKIVKLKSSILWVFHLWHRAVVFTRLHFLWRQKCLRWDGFQQHLLGIDGRAAVREREFVIIAKHDRFGRTGILAVSTENTAQHIDLVGGGIPLSGREAFFICILRSFHE